MKNLFLILIITIGLIGCASNQPKPEIIKVTEYKLLTIPDPLLQKCLTTVPPAIDSYLTKTAEERNTVDTDYIISLTFDIKNCNDQLNGIKDLQIKQLNSMKDIQK